MRTTDNMVGNAITMTMAVELFLGSRLLVNLGQSILVQLKEWDLVSGQGKGSCYGGRGVRGRL